MFKFFEKDSAEFWMNCNNIESDYVQFSLNIFSKSHSVYIPKIDFTIKEIRRLILWLSGLSDTGKILLLDGDISFELVSSDEFCWKIKLDLNVFDFSGNSKISQTFNFSQDKLNSLIEWFKDVLLDYEGKFKK